jgi:hypothetical protein
MSKFKGSVPFIDIFQNHSNRCRVVTAEGFYESPRRDGDRDLIVRMTIEVEANVGTPTRGVCRICGAKNGGPDLTDQAILAFMLAYHDGARLLFADVEECEVERDTYPMRGWVNSPPDKDGQIAAMCSDCNKAVQETLNQRRKK